MSIRAGLQGAIRILGFEPGRAKHPLSYPLEGRSLFLLKKRLAGVEQLAGTLQISTYLDGGDGSQHG